MQNDVQHSMGGLIIGQTWDDAQQGSLRIVAIDPDLHSVEAEDPTGVLVLDTIEHFTATRRALPLAG
jgi:hypothetical protein